jgi:hypothetical protein
MFSLSIGSASPTRRPALAPPAAAPVTPGADAATLDTTAAAPTAAETASALSCCNGGEGRSEGDMGSESVMRQECYRLN